MSPYSFFAALILPRATAPAMVHNRGVRNSMHYMRKTWRGKHPIYYHRRGGDPYDNNYQMQGAYAHVRAYHKHLERQLKQRKLAAFRRLIGNYIVPNVIANQEIWHRKKRKIYEPDPAIKYAKISPRWQI